MWQISWAEHESSNNFDKFSPFPVPARPISSIDAPSLPQVCEGQPTKATRMMQAEEAVSRIKVSAPECNLRALIWPNTVSSLFSSTFVLLLLSRLWWVQLILYTGSGVGRTPTQLSSSPFSQSEKMSPSFRPFSSRFSLSSDTRNLAVSFLSLSLPPSAAAFKWAHFPAIFSPPCSVIRAETLKSGTVSGSEREIGTELFESGTSETGMGQT